MGGIPYNDNGLSRLVPSVLNVRVGASELQPLPGYVGDRAVKVGSGFNMGTPKVEIAIGKHLPESDHFGVK